MKPAKAQIKSRLLLSKIKSPQALARILKKLRPRGANKGSRIVFTNGCFDLIHSGHVTYLQQARKLGTHLVVALNTDESVQKIKGPDRPINTLADRLQVIAALESVDFVTWFGEETPLKLILKLQPDVLVKGGDWNKQNLVGATEVQAWGGSVKLLTYVQGRSTTGMIQKAQKARKT